MMAISLDMLLKISIIEIYYKNMHLKLRPYHSRDIDLASIFYNFPHCLQAEGLDVGYPYRHRTRHVDGDEAIFDRRSDWEIWILLVPDLP